MPENLTAKEAATYFRRSARTILRWIGEDLFPHAVNVHNGGWMIPKSDVDNLRMRFVREQAERQAPTVKPARGFVSRWR